MTDQKPPQPARADGYTPPQYWEPGGVARIPLYRMHDLPHGFKASDQDRRKS